MRNGQLRNNLSTAQIRELVQKENRAGNNYSNTNSEHPPGLDITRGLLNTYLPVSDSSVECPPGTVLIDCGFNIWRTVPVDKNIDLTVYGNRVVTVESEKKDGTCLIKPLVHSAPGECLYTYRAKLNRVVDGDTLWMIIDCGFNTHVRQKLRLRGINAPELKSVEGERVKEFVQSELNKCSELVVKTYRSDKI